MSTTGFCQPLKKARPRRPESRTHSHASLRSPSFLSRISYACLQVRNLQARVVLRNRGHRDVGAIGDGVLAHEQAEEHVEGKCFLRFFDLES